MRGPDDEKRALRAEILTLREARAKASDSEAQARLDTVIGEKKARLLALVRGHPVEDHPAAPRGAGWVLCPFDLPAVLALLPGLSVREGFRVLAYAYRQGGNGNGVVWAQPSYLAPPSSQFTPDSLFSPPRPPGAVPLLEALTGDGAPRTLLYASLLARELADFAARWHGISWGSHQILDALPPSPWSWQHKLSAHWPAFSAGAVQTFDLRPRAVVHPDGSAVVSLLTISQLGTERLLEHTDTYRAGSYRPNTESRVVATGGPGYVH